MKPVDYTRIAESVVKSAVRNHLNEELREHTRKVARQAAKTWVRSNLGKLNAEIAKLVNQELDSQIGKVVSSAAKAVRLHAPIARRRRRW